MLPSANRLKRKKDFDKVFKGGKGAKEDFLFLKFLKKEREETRIGFVVSQKISKKAVVRNKIKRRLREIMRLRLNKIKKGFDLVIVTLAGIDKRGFQELEKTVDKLLKKARLTTSSKQTAASNQ